MGPAPGVPPAPRVSRGSARFPLGLPFPAAPLLKPLSEALSGQLGLGLAAAARGSPFGFSFRFSSDPKRGAGEGAEGSAAPARPREQRCN